ncbi:MAG: hypothetical protein M1465_01705 [Candidatus Marsarchaeota archaeon]|jgi:hypothetical protein|nr:hypothetical protein [Candidatus Marsarchaeota archaeon]
MKSHFGIYDFLSLIFAPQISPAYWFLLLYIRGGTILSVAIAITFSSLIQTCALLVYAKTSNAGFYVADKEKRLPLFIISISAYIIGFVLLEVTASPFIFRVLMLAYVINTIIAALITKYLTKVSIHTWGISGPSVALLYAYGSYAFIGMLALSLIVGYSRIKVGAHDIKQVVSALAISVLITIFVIYVIGRYI